MTAARPDCLDCATALERLDAVWLDPLPDEPLDADLSAAWEHVQDCSACWSALQLRRDADQRISELMQSLPVPGHLKERLLTQSAVATSEVSQPATVVQPISHRRRVWTITSAAAMLVFAASGAWLWSVLSVQPVALQALREQTPIDATGLFLSGDPAKLPPAPATWLRVRYLTLDPPRQWTLPNSKAVASWRAFELKIARQPSIRGVLLATLESNVLDPPPALIVAPAVGYTTRDGKPFAVAAWSEHGVVYVCFVPGDSKSLERLLRITTPTAA